MVTKRKHKPLIKITQESNNPFYGYQHRNHRTRKRIIPQQHNKKQILQKIKNKEQNKEINKLKK